MAQNYYEELGVTRDATPDEIKRAIANLPESIIPM